MFTVIIKTTIKNFVLFAGIPMILSFFWMDGFILGIYILIVSLIESFFVLRARENNKNN